MRFEVLGPMRLTRDGEPVPLTSGRQRALLAQLLLVSGSVVSSDELIEAVWGDDLPSDPANTLQHGIAQLRKAIEPGRSRGEPPRWLISDGGGYRLDLSDHELDAAEFERTVEEATASLDDGDHGTAARTLRDGLSLWDGRAYGEFAYIDAMAAESDRLEEQRVRARELLADAEAVVSGPDSVVAELEALVSEHPFREGAWARLMRALYQSGRQAEALRAFQRASSVLGDELGIEPSDELKELENQILLHDPNLAVPRPEDRRHNLPAPTNRLVGRQETLDQILDTIRSARIVTLLGPGGTGKTRLAIEAARHLTDEYPDGVWMVRLDDLSDDELLLPTVGAAMGMPEDAAKDAIETLTDFLGDKRVLLLLDNCEHLISCVADLGEGILARCPNTTILATSQEALRLTGEHRLPVPPLRLPGEDASPFEDMTDSPSVQLFVERATATNPDWDTSPQSMAAVANIVTALDGIPLAIELAAARCDLLTTSEIALRLAERFDVLGDGPRDAPSRQRTLRSAVEWSLGLLDEADRAFFIRLGVFAGSFDAAAAAAVTGTTESQALTAIDRLLRRSLLGRDPATPLVSRFRLLETLRIFGTETMQAAGIVEEIEDRHLDHFAGDILRLDDELMGSGQTVGFAEMLANQDNLRSAMAWSLDSGRLEPGVAIAAWSGRFWDWHGSLLEASTWTSRFLDADPDPATPNLAVLTSWAGFYARELGDDGRDAELSGQALRIAESNDEPVGQAAALSGLAMGARIRGDNIGALEHGARIRALAERADLPWMIAWTDNHDGLALLAEGDLERAAAVTNSSLRGFAELGDRRATGWAVTALAQIALERSEYEESIDRAREALAISREAGDGRNATWALELASEAALLTGDQEAAERYGREAARWLEERGMPASPWRRSD